MTLQQLLVKGGTCTGPLVKNSSYSHSSGLMGTMMGQPPASFPAALLGNAIHEWFFENRKDSFELLTKADKWLCTQMYLCLKEHPLVAKLMLNAICEQKVYGHLFGVEMSYLLDAHQPKLKQGWDLKTTTADTYIECVKRFHAFGYAKQAFTYMTLAKLKNMYYVFVTKQAPFQCFILDMSMFKAELKVAAKQMEFILHFYKNYGNINIK